MPCAGPDHSCNSVIFIRSPLGEVRLGVPDSAKSSSGPIQLFVAVYRAIREALAHRRQRRALGELDRRLLDDIGVSQADAEAEILKPTWDGVAAPVSDVTRPADDRE
jgi:uncharacterized protein YjiS (DUF1127 family)